MNVSARARVRRADAEKSSSGQFESESVSGPGPEPALRPARGRGRGRCGAVACGAGVPGLLAFAAQLFRRRALGASLAALLGRGHRPGHVLGSRVVLGAMSL